MNIYLPCAWLLFDAVSAGGWLQMAGLPARSPQRSFLCINSAVVRPIDTGVAGDANVCLLGFRHIFCAAEMTTVPSQGKQEVWKKERCEAVEASQTKART